MRQRLLVLATPVALLAGGWAIFYVLKEPPRGSPCEGGPVTGVEAYRRGLGAYATLSAVVLGGLILSIEHGPRTRYALAACAWLAGLYNAENHAFEPHLTAAGVGTLFGGELILAITALVALTSRRPRGSLLVYLWLVLVMALPAAVAFPALEGVAWLCFD